MSRLDTSPRKDGSARLLAVGELVPPGSDPSEFGAIACLTFDEVTPEALVAHNPDIVLSPLVGQGFDCLDLAEQLTEAGFHGKYRAVAPNVPNPELVRREISDRFPELDFDLVLIDDLG